MTGTTVPSIAVTGFDEGIGAHLVPEAVRQLSPEKDPSSTDRGPRSNAETRKIQFLLMIGEGSR